MTQANPPITGREPRLSATHAHRRGLQRLLPRRLGTLLNAIAPGALSPAAAAAMLDSSDFYVRFNAARLLAERGDRDARLIMAQALETGSGPTRASVARQLFRFTWFTAEPLLRTALADEDERVREGAVYALCDLRELSAYRLLADVLEAETDAVRAAAAWGLRNCQDSAAVPVLAAVLKAHDPDVRVKALEALSATSTREAIPVVERALYRDTDDYVIYHAALSWIELRGDDVLFDLADMILRSSGARLAPILQGAFHATNYLQVRPDQHPAADALLVALAHAISDDNANVRSAAVWLLAWMRLDRAGETLEQAFAREISTEVRLHMLRVTVSLMSTSAPRLLAIARDCGDPAVETLGERFTAAIERGAFAAYDEEDVPQVPLERDEIRFY